MLFVFCSRHIVVFFFNDTATTEIYPLSLHDALPISVHVGGRLLVIDEARRIVRLDPAGRRLAAQAGFHWSRGDETDRKSTRLNSSHLVISYAVFCLKKKTTHMLLATALLITTYTQAC